MEINCDDPTFFSDVAKSADALRASVWPNHYSAEVVKLKERIREVASKKRRKENGQDKDR